MENQETGPVQPGIVPEGAEGQETEEAAGTSGMRTTTLKSAGGDDAGCPAPGTDEGNVEGEGNVEEKDPGEDAGEEDPGEEERLAGARDILQGWAIQAREARALYPGLDLAVEAGEPRFLQLLGAGVDVRTAYEVVHRDEILSGAMQYAARQAARKTAEDIRARGARPLENGATGSAGSAPGRLHVRDMDRDQVLEIAKAAHRGQKTRLR